MMAAGGIVQFVLWMFVTYGVTLVITGSKLTRSFRRLLKPLADDSKSQSSTNPPLPRGKVQTFFGTLFECPMCMGFWVGLGLSLVGLHPAHVVLDPSVLPPFLERLTLHLIDGAASITACWGIHVALYRLGAQDL